MTSSKQMQMNSTYRTTIKNGHISDGQSGAALGSLSHEARQEKVKRITSNLPEVYNKYFFTTIGAEDNTKSRKVLAKDGTHFTTPVSPTKGNISLNQT